MGVVDTEALGQAIAAREQRMLTELLDEANGSIVEYRQIIEEKDAVIAQYAKMAFDNAMEIARLKTRCENEAALVRAIATRDAWAKGLADVADYAQECRRTTDFQR